MGIEVESADRPSGECHNRINGLEAYGIQWCGDTAEDGQPALCELPGCRNVSAEPKSTPTSEQPDKGMAEQFYALQQRVERLEKIWCDAPNGDHPNEGTDACSDETPEATEGGPCSSTRPPDAFDHLRECLSEAYKGGYDQRGATCSDEPAVRPQDEFDIAWEQYCPTVAEVRKNGLGGEFKSALREAFTTAIENERQTSDALRASIQKLHRAVAVIANAAREAL